MVIPLKTTTSFLYHQLTLTEKNAYYMCVKLFNKLTFNIKCMNGVQKIIKEVEHRY